MVGLVDDEGRILAKERFPSQDDGRKILKDIVAYGEHLLVQAGEPVAACGVGFGGPYDYANQRLWRSMHVASWETIDLRRELSNAFSLPCVVDNDANTAALGEFRFGAGRGVSSLFYATVSTGIGGGLVIDGQVYRGRNSLAGEIGHTQVVPGGRLCTCGRHGCLEAYASGWAITARARELLALDGSPSLMRPMRQTTAGGGSGAEQGPTAKEVFAAAAAGDQLAVQVVHEACAALAEGLAHIINLFDPELIVIGGGLAQAGEQLFGPVREMLPDLLFSPVKRSVACVPAALGDDAVLLGAAALAAAGWHGW